MAMQRQQCALQADHLYVPWPLVAADKCKVSSITIPLVGTFDTYKCCEEGKTCITKDTNNKLQICCAKGKPVAFTST